jgi:hypothetical protein
MSLTPQEHLSIVCLARKHRDGLTCVLLQLHIVERARKGFDLLLCSLQSTAAVSRS